MKIHHISYATSEYFFSQRLNSFSAKFFGKVQNNICYSYADLDPSFVSLNKSILSKKRGAGYWIWKPYIVSKQLSKIDYGDYLLYTDSSLFILKPINKLIELMLSRNIDVLIFNLKHIEKVYTKSEIFYYLDCIDDRFLETEQRLATYFILKKTEKTIKFINEWLNLSQIHNLIDDTLDPSFPILSVDFKENRHDQSIFSMLSKKYGYDSFYDPGSNFRNRDITSRYSYFIPRIFYCHRLKDSQLSYIYLFKIYVLETIKSQTFVQDIITFIKSKEKLNDIRHFIRWTR